MAEDGEFKYIFDKPVFEISHILPPAKKDAEPDSKKIEAHLSFVIKSLSGLSDDDFGKEEVKAAIWDYATKEGRGSVLWPMRVALSGKDKSPDPFTLAFVLGKAETLL